MNDEDKEVRWPEDGHWGWVVVILLWCVLFTIGGAYAIANQP